TRSGPKLYRWPLRLDVGRDGCTGNPRASLAVDGVMSCVCHPLSFKLCPKLRLGDKSKRHCECVRAGDRCARLWETTASTS
ncbi:unnamed protein product, partial [Mycena citricolor]